jgi:protein gp37
MGKSTIQWTDLTWNVARGCSKVDADCKFCYMYRDSLKGTRYNPVQVEKTKTVFDFPLKYKGTKSECWNGKPLVFTSSLTDFFHEDVDSFRNEAWEIIRKCPHLIFQILTKRPERIKEHLPPDWGMGWDNVWLGTSIGSQESIRRITQLINVNASVRFLSLEPLHGPVNLDSMWVECDMCSGEQSIPIIENDEVIGGKSCPKCLIPYQGVISGIHWVIVGGESGNENGKYRYRECKLEWIKSIVDECKRGKIPVFVKQLGTHLSKQLKMSDRHGGNINEFPSQLQIREFPAV